PAGGANDVVLSVSLSPDGGTLAVGSLGGRVRLSDVRTGTVLATLEDRGAGGARVAYAPGGKLLATRGKDKSGANVIRLWDVQTKRVKQTLTGHTDSVTALAFSRDGRRLVSGARGPVKTEFHGATPIRSTVVSEMKLWDLDTGKVLWTAEGDLDLIS